MLHQTPSVETYRQLREAAGLSPKTREAAERGPPGTLFAVQVLQVKEIVTVPAMKNQTRVVGGKTRTLVGLIVNLDDYNVGADKGGAVNVIDDFDID